MSAGNQPAMVAGSRQSGFTLAALMIMIMIMSIALAVAMPAWTNLVKREKEAEAIFRGMQYAEAIRVFQQRHGRLPTTLEELVKVEPRSIRQLYPNPLNESGKWGLLMQAQQARGQARGTNVGGGPAGGPAGGSAGGSAVPTVGAGGRGRTRVGARTPTPPAQRTRSGGGGRGGVVAVPPAEEDAGNGKRAGLGKPVQRTAGPLVGVYPAADGESLRTFNGASSYKEWRFQSDLIPAPVILGADAAAPRVTSAWIGKAFRADLNVQKKQGQGPGGVRPGDLLQPRDAKNFRPGNKPSKRGG